MSISHQTVSVHLENRQADVAFDDRDAQGNILKSGRVQFTMSTALRDAITAEAAAAVTVAIASSTPQNITALVAAKVSLEADVAALEAKKAALLVADKTP